MAITIFRFTNNTDTYPGVTDLIVFNNSSGSPKNTKVSNAYCLGYEIGNSAALAENQAPSQDTAGLQHLGEIEDLYTFRLMFSKRDNNPHTYQDIFDTWVAQAKVNANWNNGRFGVAFDDRHGKNITPVRTGNSQIGLMWVDAVEKNDFIRQPLQSFITLRLKISRSDGT